LKVECELKDLWLFVVSGRTTFMGHYDHSCEECQTFFAETLEDLTPHIINYLLNASGDYTSIYKVKALVYDDKVFMRVPEYVSLSDFIDYYGEENFISCEEIKGKEYYDVFQKVRKSQEYKNAVSEAQTLKAQREKQEREAKKKQQEKRERETLKKLQEKYGE